MGLRNTKVIAKEAMLALIDSTNILGADKAIVEGMVEALKESHPTLQQNFMGCFVDTMENYAEVKPDARNESAVQFAKDVSKMDTHFPFI